MKMKEVLVILLGMVAFAGYSQEDVVVPSITGMLEYAQGNILQLAGAFSEEQMDWRPAEGVRSTGETILHTAAANYFIAMGMGFTIPEGIDPMAMESSIKGKENIIEAFKKSSDFIKEKMQMVESGSFGEEVDLGFMKSTKLSSMLIILEHNGEHKGQLIAYARANGVTPPWSQPQQSE